MRNCRILLFLVFASLVLVGCKKQKESRHIVTTIEETTVTDEPKVIGDDKNHASFGWGDKVYTARWERVADKNVIVTDGDGQKYYDNRISLSVEGPNGVIFENTFAKDNFLSYINTDYIKPAHSALMSIAFSRIAKDGNAVFLATIGSPEPMSDEFMLVQIVIDKKGNMVLQKSQDLADDADMTE